jgi:hypothetical protein
MSWKFLYLYECKQVIYCSSFYILAGVRVKSVLSYTVLFAGYQLVGCVLSVFSPQWLLILYLAERSLVSLTRYGETF